MNYHFKHYVAFSAYAYTIGQSAETARIDKYTFTIKTHTNIITYVRQNIKL